MVVIRHLIYRAMRLSEPLLANSRLVPCLRSDGSWTRGRNGNVLVWMETAAGLSQQVVPGRQLGWQLHLPGRPWLQPPDV
ncbi:hypothetical protein [Hymenobacter mucosus]|uniref:Uncharacterized protein n=1 Tax=Hymenobacter mucosus TaxID=1411120 RepID=A0A238ZZZ0_9BACT|nr:hypothetical protein [Hymenobacter mucosus]SNR88957.1 hypothetical protein SAMN06269173_110105 [Hymenobacter mucosus]